MSGFKFSNICIARHVPVVVKSPISNALTCLLIQLSMFDTADSRNTYKTVNYVHVCTGNSLPILKVVTLNS